MKDKDIETAVNRMIVKEKKTSPKTSKSKDPTDAAGWLRKAYIDADVFLKKTRLSITHMEISCLSVRGENGIILPLFLLRYGRSG